MKLSVVCGRTSARWLLAAVLALGAAGCSNGTDPGSLKPVNVGFPPSSRGLGTLAVTDDGRAFVQLWRDGVWVLNGSLEEDTQVWVRRNDVGEVAELSSFVKGVGVIASVTVDKPRYFAITDAGSTELPRLADGTRVNPVLKTTSGALLGTASDITVNKPLQRLAPGASTWEEIPGTPPSTGASGAIVSGVQHPNGKVYATNGSRVFELPADLSSATKLFDCDTRELGSCNGSANLVGGIRMDSAGTLTLGVTNDEVELYSFRPGDARLTRRAILRSPINEQSYFGRPYALVVDRNNNAYLAVRTEQVGGEGHVLAHRDGDGPLEWVTVATGLPRVLNLVIDGKDGLWLWDHSDSYTGLWKLVDSSVECPKCIAP